MFYPKKSSFKWGEASQKSSRKIANFPIFLQFLFLHWRIPVKTTLLPAFLEQLTQKIQRDVISSGLITSQKGDLPIERLSDIHDTILRLLAECRWVSPALLELTGYSYTYRTRALKLLLQQQYIRKQGEGRAKAYAISTKGRNYLAAFLCRPIPG